MASWSIGAWKGAALRKLRRFNLKTWGLELAPNHCELPMLSSNNDSLQPWLNPQTPSLRFPPFPAPTLCICGQWKPDTRLELSVTWALSEWDCWHKAHIVRPHISTLFTCRRRQFSMLTFLDKRYDLRQSHHWYVGLCKNILFWVGSPLFN